MKSSPVSMQVACLSIHFIPNKSNFVFRVPHFYENFLIFDENNKAQLNSPGCQFGFHTNELSIKVHNSDRHEDGSKECLFTSNYWELWRNNLQQLIFIDQFQSPIIKVMIEPNFKNGIVFVAVSPSNTGPFYPLRNLDIQIFLNWLGTFGDIILHASGIITSCNTGYCFAGMSGAGKSTLARTLASRYSLQVLGEDNLILRYLDGQAFVFGTPWHEEPAMCSPVGVPLEKLFFLDQNAEPGIHPIPPIKGVSYLLKTAFIPYYRPDLLPKILENLSQLAEQMRFFTLNYELGEDIWESIQEV